MPKRIERWVFSLLVAASAGWLFQTGCLANLQREIEILGAPEANLNQIYQSDLVDLFGPKILQFW